MAPEGTLAPGFVDALLEAMVSLAGGDFSVRLPRSGSRDTQDSIAYVVNMMAEEIGEVFTQRTADRVAMEALVEGATSVLVGLAAGEFEAQVERRFDGSPSDVLAYLVNTAAEEVRDLFSDLKRKNELLEARANGQAVADRAAFATLSAGVGHELNNPLSFTLGNLDYLHRELEDLASAGRIPQIAELLESIRDAKEGVSRAARIASDLKKLAPSVEMIFSVLSVEDVVESALALIRNTVHHRARLVCDYDGGTRIRVDRGRIGQVLVNLVQNALNAFPEGRPSTRNLLRIVSRRRSSRLVSIEVIDNGCGISPEHLPRIFDSFFTTQPVGQGTGLGLTISKRMISDHGGRIEVESVVDEGTTFRILLPIATEVS